MATTLISLQFEKITIIPLTKNSLEKLFQFLPFAVKYEI